MRNLEIRLDADGVSPSYITLPVVTDREMEDFKAYTAVKILTIEENLEKLSEYIVELQKRLVNQMNVLDQRSKLVAEGNWDLVKRNQVNDGD